MKVFEMNSVGGLPDVWRGVGGKMNARDLPTHCIYIRKKIGSDASVNVEVFCQGRVELRDGQPMIGIGGRIIPGFESTVGPEVWTMRVVEEASA